MSESTQSTPEAQPTEAGQDATQPVSPTAEQHDGDTTTEQDPADPGADGVGIDPADNVADAPEPEPVKDEDKPEWNVATHGPVPAEYAEQYRVVEG